MLPLLLCFTAVAGLLSGFGPGDAPAGELRVRRPPPAGRSIDPGHGDPNGASQHAGARPPQGPYFPHLILSRTGENRPVRGNAYWDPTSNLPPSVLSPKALERAKRLLEAGSSDEFRSLQRASDTPELEVVRICVLRVDFLNDRPGEKTTGDGRFDLRSAEDVPDVYLDPPPHNKAYFDSHMEALRRYYDVQSDGWLRLEWDVYPSAGDSAIHLPDTFRYGPWIFSNSNPDVYQRAVDLVGDALAAAESSALDDIDFRNYDSIVIFHAGSELQSDINGDSPWDIPSFNIGREEPWIVEGPSGADSINLVAVLPEYTGQDGFEAAINSVIAHEFGHQLGFWDLYDVLTGTPTVGGFSLMDSGTNLYALIQDPADTTQTIAIRGMLPSGLDPWHKAVYFPLESLELVDIRDRIVDPDQPAEVLLPAVEERNVVVYAPLNLAEYYLLENRHIDLNGDSTLVLGTDPKTGVILGPEADSSAVGDKLAFREYDYLMPGEGVLCWHVDLKAMSASFSITSGPNVFYDRPGVGLIEADGIRDIGSASNEYLGGPYDPLFLGGYNTLGPATRPSTDTNDGTPSGLSVTVPDSIGMEMRVQVGFNQSPRGWPVLVLGTPGDDQILSLDLERDGLSEVLMAAGRGILAFRSDGAPIHGIEGSALLTELPGGVRGAIAGTERFRYPVPVGLAPLVAAVAKGRIHLIDEEGTDYYQWPRRDSLVTSSPAIHDSLVWVGCDDGWLRSFVGNFQFAKRDTFEVASAAVRCVGAGRASDADPVRVFWAAEDGSIGAFRFADGERKEPWSRGTSHGVPAGVFCLEAGQGPSYLYAWESGALEWRDASGTLRPGWPVALGDSLAGPPIVADADQDGVLETIALTRGGRLHAIDPGGIAERGWPTRIWSEDDDDPPNAVSSPRALDLDGDGRVEIVVHRPDGILVAFRGSAELAEVRPYSLGSIGVSGPEWVAPDPAEPGAVARLCFANLRGQTEDSLDVSAVSQIRFPGASASGAGFFPRVGVDGTRSAVYPREWVPTEVAAAPGLDPDIRFYPNPVRGEHLFVSFTVGEAAALSLDAFDLTGSKVATLRGQAEAGAGGNRVAWDLGKLSPGLYHVRLRLKGATVDHEQFERVAVVK